MIDMVKKCICKVIGDAVLPEKKNSVNGVQIAALIFSILAFTVCTAKFVYDIMSKKKCCRFSQGNRKINSASRISKAKAIRWVTLIGFSLPENPLQRSERLAASCVKQISRLRTRSLFPGTPPPGI